jgi:hypothetical protein
LTIHPDDIDAGLQVTIRRRRQRTLTINHRNGAVSTREEYFHVLEPGTITDVRRRSNGKVYEIQARNEVSGKILWFSARVNERTRVHTGYFRKGLIQSRPYELVLERLPEAYDPKPS